MKVRIDPEMCQGHQMCAIVAPDLFGADDEGYGITLIDGEIPSELEDDARTAQNSCPERAVIVQE